MATANPNSYYVVNEAKVALLKQSKPWMKDSTYFKKVKVSGSAAMKMIAHASAGVEKGLRSQNAMPIEVMGLMQGHMDTEEKGCLIVTDVSGGAAPLFCWCNSRGK